LPYRKLDAAIQAITASLAEPADVGQVLDRIVIAARDNVPGSNYASITVRHQDETLETVAATDPIVVAIDQMQYTLREGPSYDAVVADTLTYSNDLEGEAHWPRYGPRAAELGVRSQIAVRIVGDERSATVLNLYARERDGFEEIHGMPELLASQARIVLGYASHLESLRGALHSREAIGQAIGILRERYKINEDHAFQYLIRLSQNNNVKLRDVAASINGIDPHGPPAVDHGSPSSYPFDVHDFRPDSV
jgi:hypothetical protein